MTQITQMIEDGLRCPTRIQRHDRLSPRTGSFPQWQRARCTFARDDTAHARRSPSPTLLRFAAMTVTTATESTLQNKLFINGDFADARDGATFVTTNPATEEKIT